MPNMSYQIIGVEQVIQNLQRLQSQIRQSTPIALTDAANVLRDAAITNLQGSVGTGRWGPWGHSIEHQAISDKNSWMKSYPKWNEVILESMSKHSMVVEYGGGFGLGVAGAAMVEKQNGVFPIGASEGGPVYFRPRFAVQRGYAYTTRAINDPNTLNAMVNEVGKIFSRTIASVGVK